MKSTMVANMMKAMALHYILYHGVKISSYNGAPKNTNTRILNAQIDTKLFQCLYAAERKVYQELQRLIFKSSGQLTRDAIIPVCLTLWLLIRLQCLRASYLSNLRPKTSSGTFSLIPGSFPFLSTDQFPLTNFIQPKIPSFQHPPTPPPPPRTNITRSPSSSPPSPLSSAPQHPSSSTSRTVLTKIYSTTMKSCWDWQRK